MRRPTKTQGLRLAAVGMLIAMAASAGLAKRAAPPAVKPLLVGNVRYVAHHEVKRANGRPTAFEALLEAYDVKSGTMPWRVLVYRITYRQDLETDIQDVWISALAARGQDVEVTNESGDRYLVDTSARTVQKL